MGTRRAVLALSLVAALLALRTGLAGDDDHRKVPGALAQNGFGADLDAALSKARAEKKLVLLYGTPGWFRCIFCQSVENGAFSSGEFKGVTEGVLPVRLVLDREHPLLARYGIDQFPAIKVLDADGFVLAEPDGNELADLKKAVADARKEGEAWKEYLARADLKRGDVRSYLVQKHLWRGDAKAALEAFSGFEATDASEAHWGAFAAVARHRTLSRQFAEVEELLARGAKVFVTAEQKKELAELGAAVYLARIEQGVARRDKAACLKALDELCEKYPEHDAAKGKERVTKNIEAQIDAEKK